MNRIVQVVSAAILVLLVGPRLVTGMVEPDEIGVRQSLIGGVHPEDFGPGRVLTLPLLHTLHTLPSTLHYEEFLHNRALKIRTRENNVFEVDAVIVYRIKPGEAHLIVEQGFKDTYRERVLSVSQGFLRDHFSQLTIEEFQVPEQREKLQASAREPLNERLAQYHVEVTDPGVIIRAIRFRPEYEQRLQTKQRLVVEARLDQAKEAESEARQATATVEKEIEKEVKLEEEAWNGRIEEARTRYEVAIAEVDAQATRYDRERRAAADALCAVARADGERALALAEAYGERLRAEALSSRAGRTYSAIKAAEAFKLGQVELNSLDPAFLQEFGSMDRWRAFFLGAR